MAEYNDRHKPSPPEFVVAGPEGSVKQDGLLYMSGFGCHFQSEALKGALPIAQSNPQKCPYNAYCELLSGTSFTTPRANNQRTWFYRTHPTAGHPPMKPADPAQVSEQCISDFSSQPVNPNQFRWSPFPLPEANQSVDFLQGIKTITGSGAPDTKHGIAIHMYTFNTQMKDKAYVNSDGDYLFVPQQHGIEVQTECGLMKVPVGHICVVPRGITFSVNPLDQPEGQASRGYILEVFDSHFKLPELGPLGSNGLANPRDFLTPVAHYEHRACDFTVYQKYAGKFFSYPLKYSPFNVIAWHGNYVPYMYDLNRFVPAGAVRIDHLDPSIFTVLTAPTTEPGVAAADFVIFPPRWAVQENTFRPPWYHRNCMAEFMGNIYGRYEARPDGFLPGGASLHLPMIGHGPDSDTFDKASNTPLPAAHRMPDDSLAFMFETTYMLRLTQYSNDIHKPDPNYWKCWEPLAVQFDANDVPEHVRDVKTHH